MNYLYNGVELPALPEWDKGKYPYAAICKALDLYYVVYYSAIPIVKVPSFVGERISNEVCSAISYLWYVEKPEWEYSEEYSGENIPAGERVGATGSAIWTNFDIYTTKGKLYLTASCPIDAETGEKIHDYCLHPTTDPIDKASFLQGWIVGRRLAGMRK